MMMMKVVEVHEWRGGEEYVSRRSNNPRARGPSSNKRRTDAGTTNRSTRSESWSAYNNWSATKSRSTPKSGSANNSRSASKTRTAAYRAM
jgi:hypothetical protein